MQKVYCAQNTIEHVYELKNALKCKYTKYHPYKLHGFTLVEMLVVIAIIAILSSLLLPSLKKTIEMGRSVSCANNQRQCGIALNGYSNDFKGWVIAGNTSASVPYQILGTMMIYMGYVETEHGNLYNSSGQITGGGSVPVKNNAAFSCTELPTPSSYIYKGKTYPFLSKYPASSGQCYGLRINVSSNTKNPGEKVYSGGGLIRYSSIYQPSKIPFMVDSVKDLPTSGSATVPGQVDYWYPASNNNYALHLRHLDKANTWCPDGHVEAWGIVDTFDHKVYYNGNPA